MKYLRKQAKAGRSLGYSGTMLAEVLSGMRIVQVFQREAHEQRKYEFEGARYLKIMKRAIFARGVYSPIMEIAGVVGFALLLVYATERIATGDLEAAFLLSFMTTVLMVYQPVKQIGRVSNQILVGVAAAERIFEVIDAEETIADKAIAQTKDDLQKGISFKNLHFAYPGREETLTEINLEIPKGKVVALVGASGAGKSTMAALVPRFTDPQKGAVLFDDQDIRELKLTSVRKLVSVVTQDTILFSGSIRENIAYARPDASETEIAAAAQAAFCSDFIAEQPDGYNTLIGERGVRLSGGQRQRLCVARAILAGAPVLVLDEATSALDTESERMVQRALDNLMQGRTSLVIAHRLSTILHADQIIVMNAGRIVERGTHEELLEKEGEYSRLYHMQFHK